MKILPHVRKKLNRYKQRYPLKSLNLLRSRKSSFEVAPTTLATNRNSNPSPTDLDFRSCHMVKMKPPCQISRSEVRFLQLIVRTDRHTHTQRTECSTWTTNFIDDRMELRPQCFASK